MHHPNNRGYGGALQTGFRSATKELIFYTDGDAQYDPAELAVLWAQMTPDVDLVNGYKISRSDPLHRIVIGRVYHHIVSLLFGLKVRDVDCDFRLMRRVDLRAHQPGEDERRHLPRDDEEDPGRRLPDRRGAGAPLPPRVRQVAVLQLPPPASGPAVDVLLLWYALVVRREHRRAGLTPLAQRGADSANRTYPSAPRP